MLVTLVTRLVELCSRHASAVLIIAAVAATGSGIYAARHFAITTDINNLLAPNLEWRKRERAYEAEFPGSVNSILVVIDAPTPELASEAADQLTRKLQQQPQLFKAVKPLDRDPFFTRNGLLFQSETELADTTRGLASAGPIIGALASDPSLRGLTRGLSFGLLGVQSGGQKLDDLTRPLSMAADTVDKVLAGEPTGFSWHRLLSGKAPEPKDKEVGQLIRAQRLVCRMSQTELANALGVTFQQVQKYEKGVNRVGAGRLAKIADTLGVPISFFFDGAPGPRTAAGNVNEIGRAHV